MPMIRISTLSSIVFVFMLAFVSQSAHACGCVAVDVIEADKSCSNPNYQHGCIAQYSIRGCNPQSPSDTHCVAFTSLCCNLISYSNANEGTACRSCGGHPCLTAKANKQGRHSKLADNVIDGLEIGGLSKSRR